MTFFDCISQLCVNKGISLDKLCKDLNLSNATATKWRRGAIPRNSTVKAIADYFGVTTETLLTGEKEKALGEIPEGLTELDAEIIKAYSSLSEEKKQQALSYLEFLRSQGGE